MKLFGFLIFFLSSQIAFSQNIDYSISGTITLLKQPKSMDCWITVTTMMLAWKDSNNYSVAHIADKLGDPWKLYFQMNTGLPESEQKAFMDKIGLKSEPPANYMVRAYSAFLREHGPIWIITGNLLGAHARLLIGVEGRDENIAQFVLIDPATGTIVKQNGLKFLQEFEEEARIANRHNWKDVRIQIYHF